MHRAVRSAIRSLWALSFCKYYDMFFYESIRDVGSFVFLHKTVSAYSFGKIQKRRMDGDGKHDTICAGA
ncbi:hypothetical protein B4099_0790 [Heyndrickxia coagulans]|uniref:Uncharacterized protein n=1 Tax=Heyndrickxia coagulans TaxID=1398 RepID=A0A150KE94_HEYCO|nr:hypothetical protein B4099_0790 [Heyndrickxia coagulans]